MKFGYDYTGTQSNHLEVWGLDPLSGVTDCITSANRLSGCQQIKNALISREERKRVETLLEEHGKLSPDGLHAAVRKIESCKPVERAKYAGRFFTDFTRYHRDLRRMELVMANMERPSARTSVNMWPASARRARLGADPMSFSADKVSSTKPFVSTAASCNKPRERMRGLLNSMLDFAAVRKPRYELVDLKEVNLPFLDEPAHPRLHKY